MSEKINELMEKVRPIDEHARIMGSFFLRDPGLQKIFIPDGISDSLVGVEMPVRYPALLDRHDPAVFVDFHDLVLSLVIQHNEPAAEHYAQLRDIVVHRPTYWGEFFNGDDRDVVLDSPVSADAYYAYLERKYRWSQT